MRSRSLLSATVALLLSSASIGAAQTTIDFEDLSSSTVPSSYAGVNWSSGWNLYTNWYTEYYNSKSGTKSVYQSSSAGSFAFAPTTFQGAWFSGYPDRCGAGCNPVFFRLFLNGNLLHTSSVLDINPSPAFLASGYSGVVDMVEVNGAGAYYVMDDVTFDSTVTPEPVSMALLGTGLAGLGAVRRRRRERETSRS